MQHGTKSRRNNLARRGLVIFFLILLSVVLLGRLPGAARAVRNALSLTNMQNIAGSMVDFASDQGFSREFLIVEGAPVLSGVNSDLVFAGRRRMLTLSFYTLTRVDITDPRTFFAVQMPVIAMETKGAYNPGDPEKEGPILELVEENPLVTPKDESPQGPALVGIYDTHNSESYIGDGGPDHVSGKNGEVVQVAAALGQSLKKFGIPLVSSDKIHDYPVLERAYSESIITASQMVKANPKLQVLLDVHRDGVPAGARKRVVSVNGQPAAAVMIVLGVHHDNWQKNEEFAKQLVAKGNELYPGLFLPIYYASDARYNQHLHPHALLLEFGDQFNTTAEAKRSAEAVAKVLSELIVH